MSEEIPEEAYPKKIRRIRKLAKQILEDKELDAWLWEHTHSPEHYDSVKDALRYIATTRFVEWESVTSPVTA